MNRRLAASAAALVVLLAGCGGYDPTVVPEPAASSAAPADPPDCENDGSQLRSFEPTGDVTQLPGVEAIRKRGRLVAGVAADVFLLSSRDPQNPQRLQGFDIDMVNAIAAKIFGTSQDKVTFRVITAAERIPLLQSGEIDIVARNMTITCDRWEQIAFSQVYFDAGQGVLTGVGSGIDSVADLAGRRVCASAGTTSIANIQEIAPEAIPVSAPDNSTCMVRFQNGEADAVTGDDTVLAGLAAQDPYSRVLPIDPLSDEPYGIGVSAENRDLVELVNRTLEDLRRDGGWEESYDRWFAEVLGPATQPEPVYGR
ncbi:glutamate ABC transporter substrate-binding protein [Nocardioides marinquilinus]|uniref:Glutamate ABC transporter substrate-binding protein n=1 Tax=Nocardioides marinquilinus TaxID=1210400 RepID=A0ABP9PSH9_9ACTN